MTNNEVINFLDQIRKILLDDKSWLESTIQPINEAFDMAIDALTNERTETHACDCISRQAAIDAIFSEPLYKPGMKKRDVDVVIPAIYEKIKSLSPAQPEITDEQAIEHLRESGWMQNHDKQMYEMGLREQLADDSDSYDALLPPAQPGQAVKDCRNCKYGKYNDHWKTHFCYNPNECTEWNLWEPSAQPEIIHCRDCRWRNDQNGSTAWLPCRAIVTPSDFYCGRAERRTDEDN